MKLPANIPKRIWAPSFVLLLLTGILSSVLQAELPLVYTRSSYGATPSAWGAAYDLLSELKLGPSRSRERLSLRPASSTQWLIEPTWSERERAHELTSLERFAHKGGTVLLIGADDDVWRELGLERVMRSKVDESNPASPARKSSTDHTTRAASSRDLAKALFTLPEASELTGSFLPRPRSVEIAPHMLFAPESRGFEVRARTSDGAFVLERAIGTGRLVAVAASEFLSNERLANADNAQFLVDLRRLSGAPTFDERCHGLTPDRSLWSALGPRFLLLAGLSLLLLTLAALASARRWPLPAREPDAPPPPTLDVFVGSLASLYRARGRAEPEAVFRAYRAGFMHRLQRLLFGQREISQAQLARRVQRDASARGADARWLADDVVPTSSAELTQAVRALERYAAATHPKRRP